MSDIEKLRKCYEGIVWMAIRYAHGRSTYAPDMVRRSVKTYQAMFPDWKPPDDIVIKPPDENELSSIRLREDYLDDLFN